MPRQRNDGRGRIGGRAKGTKNRPRPTELQWLDGELTKNRQAIESHLRNDSDSKAIVYGLLSVAAAIRENTAAIMGSGSQEQEQEP